MYCCDQTLEKFMIFNKQLKNKEEFIKLRTKIVTQLGNYKHPKQLTQKDKDWLKKNIKQYDEKVLNTIIDESILPEKPKDD